MSYRLLHPVHQDNASSKVGISFLAAITAASESMAISIRKAGIRWSPFELSKGPPAEHIKNCDRMNEVIASIHNMGIPALESIPV